MRKESVIRQDLFDEFSMGYKEVRDLYKRRYGKYAKNSWIANILNEHGKIKNKSPNRKGPYKYPCPANIKSNLESVLKELKML